VSNDGEAFRNITRCPISPQGASPHEPHAPPSIRAPPPQRRYTPHALTREREPPLFPTITHPKKWAFLAAFVLCGRPVHAATQAKIDVRSHFWWMQNDQAYAQAFGQAEQMAADMAEDKAFRRGIEGVAEGVWYKGERVGTETKYSDTVLLAILNAGKPQKYKYRVDQTHDMSPAMAALLQQWQTLRNISPSARSALSTAESYTDAEVVPSPV
jgi:hypothetical protein